MNTGNLKGFCGMVSEFAEFGFISKNEYLVSDVVIMLNALQILMMMI